jgi:hypothetical protein
MIAPVEIAMTLLVFLTTGKYRKRVRRKSVYKGLLMGRSGACRRRWSGPLSEERGIEEKYLGKYKQRSIDI